jgi:hypothetical protein
MPEFFPTAITYVRQISEFQGSFHFSWSKVLLPQDCGMNVSHVKERHYYLLQLLCFNIHFLTKNIIFNGNTL